MERIGENERKRGRRKNTKVHTQLEKCVKERESGRDREGWRNRAEGHENRERQRKR